METPASILDKSIAGRYRPVSYPDGPITARYRFIKNAYWEANNSAESEEILTCSRLQEQQALITMVNCRNDRLDMNGFLVGYRYQERASLHVISTPTNIFK